MNGGEAMAYVGSLLGFVAFLHALLPEESKVLLRAFAAHVTRYLVSPPYHRFTILEHDGVRYNPLYLAVKLHLSLSPALSSSAPHVLVSPVHTASPGDDSDDDDDPSNCHVDAATGVEYSLAGDSPVEITHRGVRLWWEHRVVEKERPLLTFGGRGSNNHDEKREYTLTVHRRHRPLVQEYLKEIMRHAQEIQSSRRQKKIYTNFPEWNDWKDVPFKHPSTFETLAMDPARKNEILEDLRAFRGSQEFYNQVGRAWKRGYLLYGPPGTGKSSLVAAMANFLDYDIYDLELCDVKSNTELRQLLINTTNKAIIVIEDLDSPLDLVAKRGQGQQQDQEGNNDKDQKPEEEKKAEMKRVTLSGILNFTDGLWSCMGSERIIIFTTNHIEKLDPALLRPGRMDMHIHMSYCTFPAFRILARNYLGFNGEHPLFPQLEMKMEAAMMTPAEVSEVLIRSKHDPDAAMSSVLHALDARIERLQASSATEAGTRQITIDSDLLF